MAVDYTKTGIQSIYPQPKTFSPIVEKSKGIKPGILGSIADATSQGIDMYVQNKEVELTNEAYAKATDLTNEYLAGSPTEIQYLQGQKEKLAADLSNSDPNSRSAFQKQLDDVNNRLIRAKAQGGMTPFEFSRRVAKINQDMAQQNPGFTKEITQKMQEVYKISGISDVLQRDESFYSTMSKQQAKIAAEKQALLVKYHGYEALNLSDTQQEMLINEASRLEANTARYEALTASSKSLTEYDRQKVHEDIMANGGYKQHQTTVANSLFNQIQNVLQTEPDPNLQRQQVKLLINKARIDINGIVTETIADPAVTAFKENMNTIFNDLATYADKETNLENILQYKQNFNKIKQEDYEIENGMTEVNGFLKFADVYGKVKQNYGIDSPLLQPAERLLTKLGNRIITKLDPDSLSILDTKVKDKTLFDASMEALDRQVDGMVRNQDIKSVALYTNTRTNHLKYLSSLPESPTKNKRITETLRSMTIPSQEVFDESYNIPEFRTEITNLLNYTNGISLVRLEQFRRLNPDQDLNIYFDEDRGQVRSDNKLLDYELRTINDYITLRGRIAKKDPKFIAKDILKNNFGSLDIFGVGKGNGAVVEEIQ
jgi:hypothetical protein